MADGEVKVVISQAGAEQTAAAIGTVTAATATAVSMVGLDSGNHVVTNAVPSGGGGSTTNFTSMNVTNPASFQSTATFGGAIQVANDGGISVFSGDIRIAGRVYDFVKADPGNAIATDVGDGSHQQFLWLHPFAQSTVNGSTSGTALFTHHYLGMAGSSHDVIINCSALVGTATYTFPVAFANTPVVIYNLLDLIFIMI